MPNGYEIFFNFHFAIVGAYVLPEVLLVVGGKTHIEKVAQHFFHLLGEIVRLDFFQLGDVEKRLTGIHHISVDVAKVVEYYVAPMGKAVESGWAVGVELFVGVKQNHKRLDAVSLDGVGEVGDEAVDGGDFGREYG